MQPGDFKTTRAGENFEGMVTVAKSLERELKGFPKQVRESTLAATAEVLAYSLDGPSSATSKSMCAKALREVMDRLYELAPPAKEADSVDDLSRKRAARRAAS